MLFSAGKVSRPSAGLLVVWLAVALQQLGVVVTFSGYCCFYCHGLEASSLPLSNTAAAAVASQTNKSIINTSRRIARVVSTNKNGGHATTFSFLEQQQEPSVSSTAKAAAAAATTTTSNSRQQQAINIQKLLNVPRSIWTTRLKPALRSTFLPAGYPAKTPPGYLQYCIWSWIQDLSTQLRGVLATQRILEGVGVGRAGATALSALLNFIVRDGCGMLASLLFTAATASRFQTDVKRWRLLADIMVDIGITLEVAAPQVPRGLFLPMISVASMCKAICGVAAGATGGAINLFWSSRGGDISDIGAKFGAQHTVTGSLGLIFAAIFARSMAHVNDLYIWMLYLALTALHIFANMKCMRLIAFDSFNTVRFNMVVSDFLQQWRQQQQQQQQQQQGGSSSPPPPPLEASTPLVISKKEPLFFFISAWSQWGQKMSKKNKTSYSLTPPGRRKLQFGVSFNDFAKQSGKSPAELQQLLLSNNNNKNNSYWITTTSAEPTTASPKRRRRIVTVALCSKARPLDLAKAYFHALVILWDRMEKQQEPNVGDDDLNNLLWDSFCQHCRQAGWDLDKTQLQTRGYEIVIIEEQGEDYQQQETNDVQ